MPRHQTTDSWQVAALEQATSRVCALIRDADLATPVPDLNRWKVREVVAHLDGVHRWATRIVDKRSIAGPGFTLTPAARPGRIGVVPAVSTSDARAEVSGRPASARLGLWGRPAIADAKLKIAGDAGAAASLFSY